MRMRNIITTGTMAMTAFQAYKRYRSRSGSATTPVGRSRRR